MDWNKLVEDLKATGMTQKQIADHIGVATGTLSELLSGDVKELKWSKGDALITLHAERCSKKAA